MSQLWYSTVKDELARRVEITFNPDLGRFWPTQVLSTYRLPTEAFYDRDVVLSGPGAMWMYAHAAAEAVSAHAKAVFTQQPDLADPVCVYPLNDTTETQSGDVLWYSANRLADETVVSFEPKEDGSYWPTNVVGQISGLFGQDSIKSLCLTGRGANWMYAAMAAEGSRRGVQLITYFSPRVSAHQAIIIHGTDDPGLLVPTPTTLSNRESSKPGKIIGIVGDPGSGKSVLSKVFNYIRSELDLAGWVLDCDAASPTPNWFLNLCKYGKLDQGRILRDPQKRLWTHQMETEIADQLSNLRQCMDVVIADLPGGNHTVKPPLRIPPGREVMMQQVDAYVILGRHNEDTAAMWQEELERYNLGDRIVAILQSKDHRGTPNAQVVKEQTQYTGIVTGLDRSQDGQALLAGMRSALSPILIDLARKVEKHEN